MTSYCSDDGYDNGNGVVDISTTNLFPEAGQEGWIFLQSWKGCPFISRYHTPCPASLPCKLSILAREDTDLEETFCLGEAGLDH